MQSHNPTTQMATAAANAEAVTKTGDESPSTVLGGVNASSDTDATDHFFNKYPVNDNGDEASRQQLELWDGLGSADTKISSNSDVRSAKIALGDSTYVFEACMISVSFMLVLSSPLLRHLYSEPLALMSAIAAFISIYIIFLIFIFSPKMCLSTVFFHMPYPVLLAIATDRFVGPCGGFLVMHMATGWLASVLGYAYAEHVQNIGRETTAKHITPFTEEDERFFTDRGPIAPAFGLISLLMATIGALPLWFFPMNALSISVAFLSVFEGGAIFSWVAFVARFVLYDALLSADQLGNIMLCYICPCAAMGYIVLLFLSDTIGATFLWCLMLSIAGLLGYELSVHAECKANDPLKAGGGASGLPPLLLMTRQGVPMTKTYELVLDECMCD